jgi:hypothetical protein
MSATSPGQPLVRPTMNGRSTVTYKLHLSGARTQRGQTSTGHSGSHTAGLCCTLACVFLLAPLARASFIGVYSVPNFTVNNIDAVGGLSGTKGLVTSPDGGLSIMLTGGNSGSGLAGMTDFTLNATASGLVQFTYSYSSLDDPGFDYAGYLLANNFVQLSDSDGQCNGAPCPGSVQFSVIAGQSFGFRVGTMDNLGEPGILTISNFAAPSADTSVPEPGSGPVIVVLLAVSAAARLWRSKRSNRGEQ